MESHDKLLDHSMIGDRRVVDAPTEEENLAITNTINEISANHDPIVEYAKEPLLPLSEACAPLSDIIYNLSFYVQQALNGTSKQPPNGLTVDESAAICLYTIEWEEPHRSLYWMLNHILAKADRENLRPYYKYLKLFITALVKLPCVPPATMWRGVPKDVSTHFLPGTYVTWWAVSSCFTSLPVLENNKYMSNTGDRTLFSVEAINARTIHAHSPFANEDEVLLLPGTRMIVQSQSDLTPQLHIVHLKQVISDEVLLKPPFKGAHLYPTIERHWYRKKRFALPICLLAILLIGAIILGFLLRTRPKINPTAPICDRPFQSPISYRTGKSPVSATMGYFTDDQQLDVVVANNGDNSVSVLRGNRNGTFQTATNYMVGQRPHSVTAGDFDKDNKMDLAMVHEGDNTVSVLFGDGNGDFQTRRNYNVGLLPHAVISGDFNQDNTLDLAVANEGDNTVSVLLGNVNGRFQTPVNYKIGKHPVSMTVGDINNDNKLDLGVVNQLDNTVSVLLGNGNGAFQTPVNYKVGKYPMFVTASDLNNDNKLDMATANYWDNTVSILVGDGNGNFQTPVNYMVGKYPSSLTVGDYNNDNKVDLVVANAGDNTVSVLLGNGDGIFQNQIKYTVGNGPSCVISGDLNNDKKLDLIVTNQISGDLFIFLNTCN